MQVRQGSRCFARSLARSLSWCNKGRPGPGPLTFYPTSCGACGRHHACDGGGGWTMNAHGVVILSVHASHRHSRCCIGIDPPRASLKVAFRQRSGHRPRWVSRSCSSRRCWWRRRRWRNRNYSGMIVVRPYLLCIYMWVCLCGMCCGYVVAAVYYGYDAQVDKKEGREREKSRD